MPKKIILSKLGVDELLELIHDENTPACIRERAIRFLKKQTETAFDR